MRKRAILATLVLSLASALPEAAGQAKKTADVAPPAPVSADPQATSATFGDWLLFCQKVEASPGKMCEVNHSVQVQGQPGPIARLAVAKDKANGRMRLTLLMPTNVTLQKLPKVNVDDKDAGTEAAWVRCLPGGCFASTALADDTVKAWRGASARGRILFQDGSGQELAVTFSMRGFSQALDALAKQ